jgi:hypothetical protein
MGWDLMGWDMGGKYKPDNVMGLMYTDRKIISLLNPFSGISYLLLFYRVT